MPTLTGIIQYSFGSPSHSREEKEITGIQMQKEVKLTVCKWYDIIIGNPINTTKKLLEIVNEFSKATRYKINTHKSLALLYTKNEK